MSPERIRLRREASSRSASNERGCGRDGTGGICGSRGNRFACVGVFVGIVLLALAARLLWPELRPIHADEAVQAYIFADLLEQGIYRYDPLHYHGPLPHYLNLVLARGFGIGEWGQMPLWFLRLLPALAGTAAVALVMLCVRSRSAAWRAGVLAAVSPLLLYYSRMGIHEMVLAVLALAVPLAVRQYLQAGASGLSQSGKTAAGRRWLWAFVCGALLGALHATKETWCIIGFSWAVACVLLWPRAMWRPLAQALRGPLWVAAGAALAVSCWLYSGAGRFPEGIADAWRTLLLYETGSSHAQPWYYYISHVLTFFPASGWLWGEAAISLLALAAGVVVVRRSQCRDRAPKDGATGVALGSTAAAGSRVESLSCFLALSGLVQLCVYSLIAYKTPWLAVVPVLYLVPLAGVGWQVLVQKGRGAAPVGKTAGLGRLLGAGILLGIVLASAVPAAWLNWRTPADPYLPLVYAPTLPEADLQLKAQVATLPATGYVAVVGDDYWPLPWYFRQMAGLVGFFDVGDFAGPVSGFDAILTTQLAEAGEIVELRPGYYLQWQGAR